MQQTEKDRCLLQAIFKAMAKKGGQIIRNESDRSISRIVLSLPAKTTRDREGDSLAFILYVTFDIDLRTTTLGMIVEDDKREAEDVLRSIVSARGTRHVAIPMTGTSRGSEDREGKSQFDALMSDTKRNFEDLYGSDINNAHDIGKKDILDVIGDILIDTLEETFEFIDGEDDDDIMHSKARYKSMVKYGAQCSFDNGLIVVLQRIRRNREIDFQIKFTQDITRVVKSDRFYS